MNGNAQELPALGSVVITRGRVGIVRFVGRVGFDEQINVGVEIKGEPVPGGTDGTGLDSTKYFDAQEGHGIFTTPKDILRVIRPEELLEKVAALYDIVQEKPDCNALVDYDTYEIVARENKRLTAQLTELELIIYNLMIQNDMLQEQQRTQMIQTAELHDKVYTFSKSIGLRRPTISAFDEETLAEIGELVRAKQAQKDAAGAQAADPNGYQPPVIEERKKEETDPKKLATKRARESVEIAREYVARHIIGPIKRKARESVDLTQQQPQAHRRNQSSLEILNMADWAKDMYVPDANKIGDNAQAGPADLITTSGMFTKHKRKNSLSAANAKVNAQSYQQGSQLGGVSETSSMDDSGKKRRARGSLQMDPEDMAQSGNDFNRN